ncbi:hypothetical protein GCM10022223_06730 [Kineosporia mesophila]|uniref:NYN domain-containing protein n=1 Tax=Kineosporia mesophila TaxID=566012 RepID=A0ABP6Z118_9ACTN
MLLLDLESCLGVQPKLQTVRTKVPALMAAAQPVERVVAACAGSRIELDRRAELIRLGVDLHLVGDERDAADIALLQVAEAWAGKGCRRFVVASSDGRFARLAQFGRLEVLVWESKSPPLSTVLKAAGQVRRVPVPGARIPAQSSPGTSARQPLLTVVPDRPHTPHAPHTAAAEARSRPGVTPRVLAGWSSKAAVTFAAGVLFGAGWAFGSAVMNRAVNRGI